MTEKYISISYSHKDQGKVLEIVDVFKELGYNIWYDANISPMREWRKEIEQRLLNAEIMLAFLSNNYVKSEYCMRELRLAQENNKRILLIYLQEKVELPVDLTELLEKQAVYFTRFAGVEEFVRYLTSIELLLACKSANASKTLKAEKIPVPKKGAEGLKFTRVDFINENNQVDYSMAVSIGECDDANVIIPDLDPVHTKKVSAVYMEGFKNSYIETVVLPAHLISICSSGFNGCKSLKSVKFTSKFESLDSFAFAECISLEQINLPQTTKKIGSYSFYKSGLKSIKIPENISVIEEKAFFECLNLEQVDILEGVKRIENDAFSGCGIKCLDLPSTMKEIGKRSFERCASLNEVKFSSGLSTIGSYAFYECKSLKRVSFSQGLRTIEKSAFSFTQIEELVLPKGLITIKQDAFSFCESLKRVVIRDGTKAIERGAFSNCYKLKEIYIPASVRKLDFALSGAPKGIKIYCEATEMPIEWQGLTDGIEKPKVIFGAKMPKY